MRNYELDEKQRYISVVMENGNPRDLVKQVEGAWERYFPDSSYDYFLSRQWLFWLCFLVHISLSEEDRIRKGSRGASKAAFFELGREFFLLIAIAVVIALPLSGWIMGDWLNHYSFRTDWKAWFFLVPVVFIVCDLLADHRLANRLVAAKVRFS